MVVMVHFRPLSIYQALELALAEGKRDRPDRTTQAQASVLERMARRGPVGADTYAAVALKPRLFTAPIKTAVEVRRGSNETRAEPTATSSTFVLGRDFSAVETLAVQPPQCIP